MAIPDTKRTTNRWGVFTSGSRRLFIAILAGSFLGMVGCRLTTTPRIEISPLSYPQQAAEIVKLVPLETDREIAIETLRQAGIEGDFSPLSQSVYYCNIWKREDGKQWLMNVALLFNESGKFYATRNPEAQTEIDFGPDPHISNPH